MRLFSLYFVLAFFLSLQYQLQAQISSTFDVDSEGWTLTDNNNNDPQTVNYFPAGGNPGGYVSATKASTSQPYYWTSPSKFAGNMAYFSYGQVLSFDLQINHVGTLHSASGDVQLKLPSGSTLVFTLPSFPAQAPAWSNFSVTLDETAGWRVGGTSGPLATRDQMIQFLSTVASFRFNIKYNGGVTSPTGAIDNVVLQQRTVAPAPVISTFTPAAAEVGSSVTINGSNFDAVAANNTVYFGGVKGQITASSITAITVTVPAGAQYAPITVVNKTTGLAKQSTKPFNPLFSGGGRIIPSSIDAKQDISITGGYGGHSLADMDGDGWHDLVVARQDNTGIWVYRNLGNGGDLTSASFAAPVSFATGLSGTNGAGLATIDLDNDGKIDMVTSGWTGSPGVFATFRNTSTPGALSFEAVEYWSGRSDESPVYTAADVDGDGLMELISGEGSGGAGQNVWITQNMSKPGDIFFGYSILYFSATLDDAPSSATLGDLNNDGKPEFALVTAFGGSMVVFTNSSTPGIISFSSNFTISQGVQGRIQIHDFDLDGKNDLAWKNGFSSDDIHLRINASTSATLTAADFANEVLLDGDITTYGSMNIADINGDGKPEIVATDNGDLGVFENTYSGGAFTTSAFVPTYRFGGNGGSTYPVDALVGDLNGDNRPDIVMGVTNTTPNRISIFENKNVHAPVIAVNTVSPLSGPVGSTVTITGSNFSTTPSNNHVWFGAVEAVVTSASATVLTATVPAGAGYAPVHVTKDGLTSQYRLPFKTTFSSGVTFNNTHFATPVGYTLTGADYDIAVGDLNKDGKPDVLAEAGNQGYAFRNAFVLGPIDATTLVPTDTLSPTFFRNPRLWDLDGDGYQDVVDADTHVRQNGTSATNINFSANIAFAVSGTAAFADFNNDGKTDVATAPASAQLQIVENRIAANTFVTTPIPTFSAFPFTRPSGNGAVATADFDADGFADVVTTNAATDNISVFRNLGLPRITSAQFAARVDIAVGDNPARIYTADFDSDGKPDVLLNHGAGTTSTLLVIFQNTSTLGNISFARVDLTNPTANTDAAIADLDGDGRPEILTTSEVGNQFTIFKNQHTSGALTAASFAAPFNTAVTAPRGLATADINLDGQPEILVTRAAGLLLVYENLIPNSTMTITTQPTSTTTTCAGTIVTLATLATGVGTNAISYQWQKFNSVTSQFENIANGATFSGTNTATLSITPTTTEAGTYRAVVSDLYVTPQTTNVATLIVNSLPTAPGATGALSCTPASVILTASGASNGSYRWFSSLAGSPIAGEVNSTYTTPVLSSSRDFYVAIFDGTCESTRTPATATIGPAAPTVTNNAACGSGAISLSASGGGAGQFRWYSAATGGTAFAGETNASYTTAVISTTTTYYVSLNDGTCESPRTPVTATVNPLPSKPTITPSGALTFCTGNSVTLQLPAASSYSWSTSASTQQISVTTAGSFTATITDTNGCASPPSDAVVVVVNPLPTKPAVTAASATTFCAGNSVQLSAPAGFSYAWSNGATTQQVSINTSGSYSVSITDTNNCSSPNSDATAVIVNALPTKPVVSASATTVCPSQPPVNLTAPAGFTSYLWSDGSTTQAVSSSLPGSFTVQVTDNNGCTSVASDAVVLTVGSCNQPPFIQTTTAQTAVEGTLQIDLGSLLSDPDGNLDISSLRIVDQPTSGASASIDAGSSLILDYSGVSFSGVDELVIEVCDNLGACTQQLIKIEVAGDVIVFNGLSPNGDTFNDFFQIKYIDVLENAKQNRVTIYNRWGDEVFEIANYDNKERVFRGQNKNGNDLPSGTYLYKIEFTNNRPNQTGYLVIKR